MPRPSLKKERQAAILEAYGRCIIRHGVEGTTLEKTADEAGLARALIRHNVGNKDQLLNRFLERYFTQATEETEAFFKSLPKADRASTMIESLFDPKFAADQHDVSLTNALFNAASGNTEVAQRLIVWTAYFVDKLSDELRSAFPEAQDDKVDAVATGITALYFQVDTLRVLGKANQSLRSLGKAAHLLIDTLRD